MNNLNISNRNNNLTIVRMAAAISVVFGHSFILDDGIEQKFFGLFDVGYFGMLAVAVFFTLSGFLITQSFTRSKSVSSYLEARVLRIFPGLIFTAAITILAIYIFGKTHPTAYASAQYFLKTITLKSDNYHDYFITNPMNAANGSLWTLETEFKYYILVLAAGLLGLFRRPWIMIISAIVSTYGYLNGYKFGELIFDKVINTPPDAHQAYLNLPLCFFIGMLAFLYKKYIPISILLALILIVASALYGNWVSHAVSWSYLAFVFGFHPKLFFPKMVNMDDLSFGIYIVSFPIQQLLVMNFEGIKGISLFPSSLLVTALVAWTSWKLVEKPALEYRGRFFASIQRGWTAFRFSQKMK